MAYVKESNTLTITLESTGINVTYMSKLLTQVEEIAEDETTSPASIVAVALEVYLKDYAKKNAAISYDYGQGDIPGR